MYWVSVPIGIVQLALAALPALPLDIQAETLPLKTSLDLLDCAVYPLVSALRGVVVFMYDPCPQSRVIRYLKTREPFVHIPECPCHYPKLGEMTSRIPLNFVPKLPVVSIRCDGFLHLVP